jgi:hypothetical protein
MTVRPTLTEPVMISRDVDPVSDLLAFAARCETRGHMVAAGLITVQEAVDGLQEVAGLPGGPLRFLDVDSVQAIMADAFGRAVGYAHTMHEPGAAAPTLSPSLQDELEPIEEPPPARQHADRPTPQVTIEPVLYAISTRGLAALKEPANIERLARCDKAAMAQINKRISQLAQEKTDAS